MLEQYALQNRIKWSGTDHIIENWLKERQRLLVVYNDICKKIVSKEFQDRPSALKLLKLFCQLLTDYVSKGDFEIFERIDEAEKSCSDIESLDRDVLENIFKTSLVALDFSDRHVEGHRLHDLANDLSQLGLEIFNERFESEDEVIRHYLKVTNHHKPLTRIAKI